MKEQHYRTVSDTFQMTSHRIEQLAVQVDSIKSTYDGKLTITLSTETLSNETLEKVRDLLLIQQGQVFADFEGAQQELPL